MIPQNYNYYYRLTLINGGALFNAERPPRKI
jgi:hypothetical protein